MPNLVKAIDLRCRLIMQIHYVFHIASAIFRFLAYYINDISVTRHKNSKTCYKIFKKIADRLLQQKP